MSSAQPGPSRRRRRYATKACNTCRRRRCKCDGVQPVCGTCAATGHECSWSSDADARRPATKQLVESLRIKIRVLEAEVARLRGTESTEEVEPSLGSGIPIASSSTSQHDSHISISSSLDDEPISASTVHPPQLPLNLVANSSASKTLTGSAISPSPPAETLDDPLADRSMSTPATQFAATVMYKYIFEIDQSIPASEQPTDVQLSLLCEWNRHLPDIQGVSLSRTEHDTILSRCFKYGTSWALGMVPEIFLHDMLYSLSSAPASAQPNTPARLQHYTPMLHCALLALGCAFSDDEAIRSRETRDKFASHAKQWLHDEFRNPVMSLVRALTVLADYYCATGQREVGFMYMGMGIRAARAMIPTGVQDAWGGQGIASYPESITREWHYWSTFVQDKLMSLDFERPADMPVPRLGVNLPSVDSELDSQAWPIDPADTGTHGKNQPKITTLVFLETCKLMVIGTRVIDTTPPLGQDRSGESVALNIHLQLETWFNNLPERLLVWARSTHPLPYVILLHICYWWLLVYLHRPYYDRTQVSDSSLPTTNLSVKICERGAHKIVQLLNRFEEQHGLRFYPRNMLPAISACGDALILECTSAPPGAAKKRANAQEGVEVCVRTLRAMAPSWPCAATSADELEARLEELRPASNPNSDEMEVDQLNSPIPLSSAQQPASLPVASVQSE